MATQDICILGLTGGIGGAIADALLRHGFHLRALVRDPLAVSSRWLDRDTVTLIPGDAMRADDVIRAAQGCSSIVHAVNPAGYQNWGEFVLPMIDNSIAAAHSVGGARIVLPGTIYNFDPADTPLLDEHSPQNPKTEKGRIRKELESRLERAAAGGVPALILRAGDFFGPGARSSWFSNALVRPGAVKRMLSPGKGTGHSWANLPDLAETFARLLAVSDRLRPFERVQFEGAWDADGSLIPETIREVLGRDVPEWAFPWWLIRLLSPFGGFPAAAREIEVYWRHPVRLDNRRLVDLLGHEPRTPLPIAIRDTLAATGGLDGTLVQRTMAIA